MSERRSATSIDALLGQRVRARRRQLGMSQEQLANALGVTFQQVQKYENGANRIAASRLLDLASALDVAPDYFFKGLLHRRAGSPAMRAERELAAPGAAELVQLYAGIRDASLRRRVLDLVLAINHTQT